jgi:hypothetical protein
MAKIADGSFKNWVDTQIIGASDYVQEREMLRAAVNDNDSRLGTLESSTVGLQLGTLQLQKITNDAGGVKINVNNDVLNTKLDGTITLDLTKSDILEAIKKEGVGLHTFYAVSGSKNLPTNRSIRGIAHITGSNPTYGWVWATDYKNNVFHGYFDTDVWSGWDGDTIQKELWTSTGWYMHASQVATPSKKLSECKTGWILVWSDYDTTNNKAGDFDFVYTHIPKYSTSKYSGKQVFFPIMNYMSATAVGMTGKKLYVYDDKLVGHDDNKSADNGSNDVVLRAVVEY